MQEDRTSRPDHGKRSRVQGYGAARATHAVSVFVFQTGMEGRHGRLCWVRRVMIVRSVLCMLNYHFLYVN